MMGALFPPAAAEHAGAIDIAIDAVHVLMLILFIGWLAFFFYVILRFRQSRNPQADYIGVKSKTNTYLEVGVAVAEVILLVGFSIPMWAERVNPPPDEEGEPVEVRVVAQQFAWNIWYPGADGVFGEQDLELIDEATNPIALVRSDAGADDIFTLNQLHLPVGRPIRIHISSKDVIHSFNLPNMRIKQDAIPGLSIPVWFVPTKTTAQLREETGDPNYQMEIACAQLCGNSHYRMRGFLTVHTEEEFEAWLEEEASYLTEEDDFFN